MNNCETCALWNSINPELGECRKKAPSIRNIEDGKGTPFWPYTSRTDGCGEHEQKQNLEGEEDNVN
jgi:hypothetical protein